MTLWTFLSNDNNIIILPTDKDKCKEEYHEKNFVTAQ